MPLYRGYLLKQTLCSILDGTEPVRCQRRPAELDRVGERSYGFHDPPSLMAMIYLCCTGIVLAPVRHFPAVRA